MMRNPSASADALRALLMAEPDAQLLAFGRTPEQMQFMEAPALLQWLDERKEAEPQAAIASTPTKKATSSFELDDNERCGEEIDQIAPNEPEDEPDSPEP